MSSPNTIVLKATGLSNRAEEARAGGAVTPGDLVKYNSSGNVIRHATAGGVAQMVFAKEDTFQGKTIDDNYASTDPVFLHVAQKGDEIYAQVAANAAAIVVGDALASDGAGGFKKAAASSQLTTGNYTFTAADIVLAESLEALDNSAVAARARLRIRVR